MDANEQIVKEQIKAVNVKEGQLYAKGSLGAKSVEADRIKAQNLGNAMAGTLCRTLSLSIQEMSPTTWRIWSPQIEM